MTFNILTIVKRKLGRKEKW